MRHEAELKPERWAQFVWLCKERYTMKLKKDAGEWKIVVYHNVDVKPGVPVPGPR